MRPHDDSPAPDEDAELDAMLRSLDHPVPRVSADAIIARAHARPSPWLRRAAVIAVALGAAGTVWALPGSPLRDWLTSDDADVSSPAAAPRESSTSPNGAASGGIALDPDMPQRVVFAPSRDALLEVVVVDEDVLSIQSFGGSVRFSAELDRTRVDRIDPGTRIEVLVPRSSAGVELRVGTRVVWLWPDRAASASDPGARRRIPLDP